MGLWMPELVLYGIRELAEQHYEPLESRASTSSTNESGEHWIGLILTGALAHPIQDPKMLMKRIPKQTLKFIIEARTPFCPVPANSVM